MSGTGWRAAGVASGALALVAGCTFGTHPGSSATSPGLAASAPPPPVGSIEHPRPVECVDGLTFVAGSTALPGPYGAPPPSVTGPDNASPSPSGPAPDPLPTPGSATGGTAKGSPKGNPSPGRSSGPAADVTIGPLTLQGLRGLATAEQYAHGTHDSDGWHYRVSSEVRPHATVTVTIGAQQRARAGLEYGGGYGTTPAPAVTFHSCPGVTTTFPGGFFVAGDGRACVPLDVRVANAPPKHLVISFFNGRCSAQAGGRE